MLRYLLVVACFICMYSCQKEISSEPLPAGRHTINVRFHGIVDADSLEFGKQYSNAFYEDYKVSTLKFYVHSIQLSKGSVNSAIESEDNYFIADLSSPSTSVITVKGLSGTYDHISFILGVDSIRNVSGAQTGALDPTNGMFWTWNTGYIMVKLEGNSQLANTPNNQVQYHIGGFKGEDNVVQRIDLPLPDGVFEAKDQGSSEISISVNVNKWFSAVHPIKIAEEPVCMTPGALAKTVAENYYHMFTVNDIVSSP
jgi:hypothetical protein